MTKSKLYLFNNRFTGDIKRLTKSAGKKLSEDWSRIRIVTNDKGERVMRMELNGATVDISENETPEVVANGNTNTK